MTTTDIDLLDRLRALEFYRDQMVSTRDIPARGPLLAGPAGGLSPVANRALDSLGIRSLYAHQARAVDLLREGKNVVVVSGTASGKTLCYNLPLLERVAANPLSTALYVFPTKALAQDQLRGLETLCDGAATGLIAGTYDGDTPGDLRRRLRDRANAILTNPDMLHAGILPHHARWSRFFTHLDLVVLDEVHAYRGVFGSHVANVMRRLARICRHHGANPRFVACSATIANPAEHASRVTGVPMEVVSEDGAPRSGRRFVLWNPPLLADPDTVGAGGGDRRSALGEAVHLLTTLVREGIQTIVFTRTRLAAELVMKSTRDRLRPISRRLSESVAAYRGGYLPEERRSIERRLARREILGVASTNALELGIDIGSLDACVILGYPGTVASLTQQAGRAGRGDRESLVFLVTGNTPIDQFLANHPDWLAAKNPERAVTDADNPHIAIGHLACAAHELPLSPPDVSCFGELAEPVLQILEEDGKVRKLGDSYYFSSTDYPAAEVTLRNLAGPVVTIQDESSGGRVIGTLDLLSALSQLHDHAIYIHGGDTYFVEELDLVENVARVARRDLDYYTQAVSASQIRIDTREDERPRGGGTLGFGEVTVTTSIPMFKKVRFHSRESLGFEKLELPPQTLETVAMWLVPPADAVADLVRRGQVPGEALIGIANVLEEVVPLFLMCDTGDIGAAVDSSQLGRDALYLFDRFPGGMGYAEGARDRFDEILEAVARVIDECPCERGCPSCVGAAVPAVAATDLDTAVRGRIPDKSAALRLATHS